MFFWNKVSIFLPLNTKITQIIQTLKINHHFMKRSILFIFLFCLSSIGICEARQQVNLKLPPHPSPHPQAPARNYIDAFIDGDYLYMNFEVPVGAATITIINQTGAVVYREEADTFTNLNVIIPIDILDGGSYTITVQYLSTTATGELNL
jgi:hypothetical protein